MNPVRVLVEGSAQIGASTPAQTTISTTAALAVTENQKRKCLMIQNTGTTVLKFTLGRAIPTQTVYHFALKACAVADDGTGGIYFDDGWVGAVTAISSAAAGTYVLTEVLTSSATLAPDWNLVSDDGIRIYLANQNG